MAGAVSLTKVSIPKASAICQDIQLDQQATAGLLADPAPVDFFE